jgi:lysophospholipase L1-like esterase
MTSHSFARSVRARSITARFTIAVTIAGALVAGSVLTASTATAAPAPGVPEVTAGLEYVALGDSYSAGLGIAPPTGLPTPECAQSASNYPHQVAAAYGLELTDVTCSGADTADITTTSQYPASAPQVSALSADTDIVTITIGGNDLGFADVARSCLAQSASGPLLFPTNEGVFLPNCAAAYTAQGDSLAARLAVEVAPALATTYAQIAAAAPNAEVFVVGYPRIFPGTLPEGGCYTSPFSTANSYPFTDVDTAYLHSVEVKLDAAIQAAAAAAGFTYVPTFSTAGENSACAPVGTAYVNGVILSEAGALSSLHPNTLGVTFLTDSVSLAIDAAFPAVVVPVVPTVPTAPTAPTVPVASGPAAAAPKPMLANTGTDGGLLAGGLALAVLLFAGGGFVVASRRKTA